MATFRTIPVTKIFLDGDKELIFVRTDQYPNGERRPHGDEGRGYQRDPWARINWVEQRAPNWRDVLCKPIEVARREDGMYAAIDGGGRWLMAQFADQSHLICRVHEGLTRRDEAILFAEFDSETYKLRSIDTFIAALAGREPMAVNIAEAVRPYTIAARGRGTLRCVGALSQMYMAYAPNYQRGQRLIRKVCIATAAGWTRAEGEQAMTGPQIDGKFMNAVGMLVDVAGNQLDTSVLHRVLKNHGPKRIEKEVVEDNGPALKTTAFTILAAKHLATIYNRSFANTPDKKITANAIDNCSLWETIKESRTFSALRREAREAGREEEAA